MKILSVLPIKLAYFFVLQKTSIKILSVLPISLIFWSTKNIGLVWILKGYTHNFSVRKRLHWLRSLRHLMNELLLNNIVSKTRECTTFSMNTRPDFDPWNLKSADFFVYPSHFGNHFSFMEGRNIDIKITWDVVMS